MDHIIDMDAWPRREHFEFFKRYDNPYFNMCADVDVTELRSLCSRTDGPSYFLATLFLSLIAANRQEELRLRIRGDDVVLLDSISGGSTILRPDRTFAFGYFDFPSDFRSFAERGGEEIERVRSAEKRLDPRPERDDLIHYSVIPWVSFTSFSHARQWSVSDSIPKIVFGKHRADGKRRVMPVSVEVHHALVDGLHVGEFLEHFQTCLNEAEAHLER